MNAAPPVDLQEAVDIVTNQAHINAENQITTNNVTYVTDDYRWQSPHCQLSPPSSVSQVARFMYYISDNMVFEYKCKERCQHLVLSSWYST